MKKSLRILIIIAFALQSCEKEDDLISQNCEADCTEIVGKLMTDDGTTPIANRKITVVWDNTSSGFGTVRTKATKRTDSNGDFSISFFMRDDELESGIHRMSFERLNESEFLRSDLNGISSIPSVRDTLIVRNHNVVKKAFVNLTLLNLDDIQGSDRFWTNFDYPRPTGFSQSIDGQIRGWTSEFESNQVLEVAGNQEIIIEIVRKINDITTTENETLFVEAGTTLNYTVDFNN
ncbi:hypothetical protein BFP78_00020 [Gaetbulibacter sp. 5U11]|nr:hypothetical protein BFP78_00020 [Gaetbulibacter sp. 5U11]